MSSDFKQILAHFSNKDELLKLSFLYSLSKLDKEKMNQVEAVWQNIAVARRRKILENLVEITEESFEVDFSPIFIMALNDENAEVQVSAIKGLWENESPALVPAFLYLLKGGQNTAVRAAAASALGLFIYLGELEEIDDEVKNLVEQKLLDAIHQEDEDLEVVRRAIEAISFSSREGLDKIIENAFYHASELMRVSAVFAMGRNANQRWEEKVLLALDDDSTPIRFEAARASGEIALEKAIPKLAALIVDEDEDMEVKQNAIWSLGQIGGNTAQTLLESLVESSIEAIRVTAEEALDELSIMGDDFGMLFNFDAGDEWDDNIDDGEHTHNIDLN